MTRERAATAGGGEGGRVRSATGRATELTAAPPAAAETARGDGPTDPSGEKLRSLLALLRDLAPLDVAFSGGVDSTFLLAAAGRAQVDVRAILGVSPSLPLEARDRARRVAARLRVPLLEIATSEMQNPAYLANGPDRCYHCKAELFGVFRALNTVASAGARARALVDGTQADDAGDWRPGRRAARELGVRSPLLELGWTKREIRAMSRSWELETADLPAGPCLASRIPTGTPVTLEALARVEAAESGLGDLGFGVRRVRDHGTLARIELPREDLPRALAVHDEIVARVSLAGYRHVTLDLRGYRAAGSEVGHRDQGPAQAREDLSPARSGPADPANEG